MGGLLLVFLSVSSMAEMKSAGEPRVLEARKAQAEKNISECTNKENNNPQTVKSQTIMVHAKICTFYSGASIC